MIDFRPVFLVVGLLVAALGASMTIPLAADLLSANPAAGRDAQGFLVAGLLSVAVGGGVSAASWGRVKTLTTQQGFLITSFSWMALAAFASLPLLFGGGGLSVTDALFEAMSGLTTTGSTVVAGLDVRPPGFLLWRSMLQWFGGIGVVIMAIAILPFLSIGGMQLFRLESSDKSDKVLPGADDLAVALFGLYLALTAACFMTYWAGGMTPFDAVNHAMTTIATGGFSTKDRSFGYFVDYALFGLPLDLYATVFMVLSALPFGLYLLALRGQLSVFSDSQVRFFLTTAAIFIIIMAIRMVTTLDASVASALRESAFNIVSIMTGTGYATADYNAWGPFAVGMFFCVAFVGGCAGSTSCGLKIFRLQIALSALSVYAKSLSHPNRVTVAHYNGRTVDAAVFQSVLSFFFVYFAIFATVAVALSLFDLDVITALSAAGTAIANVGPGLGDIVGPAGNFAALPAGAKWILSAAMLLGRLELFTVLVLFVPSFWVR